MVVDRTRHQTATPKVIDHSQTTLLYTIKTFDTDVGAIEGLTQLRDQDNEEFDGA
jgi:hypothetical protein